MLVVNLMLWDYYAEINSCTKFGSVRQGCKNPLKTIAMKRITQILLFTLISTCMLNAQNISIQDGLYVDASGSIFNGKFSQFFANGFKKSEINITNGKANGYAIYFYENGAKMEAGNFIDGLRNGLWENWNEIGIKTGEANYKIGVKDGAWMVWDASGKKRMEMHYTSGNKSGTWRMWDENGTLSGERTYSEAQ